MFARHASARKRREAFAAYVKRLAGMPLRRGDVLGAPGWARAAHIVQFRPVRIERPGEEMAPEGPDFGEGFGSLAVAAHRGGEGG